MPTPSPECVSGFLFHGLLCIVFERGYTVSCFSGFNLTWNFHLVMVEIHLIMKM